VRRQFGSLVNALKKCKLAVLCFGLGSRRFDRKLDLGPGLPGGLPRKVNIVVGNSVPAAAVKQRRQAVLTRTGYKGSVDGHYLKSITVMTAY